MNILDQLAEAARQRVETAKQQLPPAEVKRQALALPMGGFRFEKALAKPGLAFICECKKASPSKGLIAPDFPYLQIAKEYEGRAVVGKVDVDENPDLAERFGIMSIPALFVFVNGEVKEKLIDYRLKMQIAEVLDKYC